MTADEWLQAHRDDQQEADQFREVNDEHEITDEPARTTAPPPSDIRETSTRHSGEDHDHGQRDRVPVIDETRAAVTRAQTALAEIDARRVAEQAHDAEDAAQRESAEQERRAELSRWHTDDTTQDQASSADLPDEMVRE